MTTSHSTRRWVFRLLFGLGLAMLLALVLAIILIGVPVTRRLIAVGLAQWMLGGNLESLAVDLDIQPNLRWIFTLLVILPVGFGLGRMMIARSFTKAARGLTLVVGILFTLGVLAWWHTRHFNFDAKGRPVVYVSFRRDGAHKSYSPDIDRVTGRPKYQVTLDRVQWLSELARQPVREMDPAVETNWFDANSGEPNLWYVPLGTNRWQFFNRPHFHQQLQVETQPITPELMARWQTEHDRQVAAAEGLRRQQEAEARAAAEEKVRKERERVKNQQREEAERAEQRRQADLRIKAEAEAHAKLDAERRERDAKQRQEQAEKRRQEQATAQAQWLAEEHQRQVNERRIREATADAYGLDQWDAASFVSRVFLGLDAQHPNAKVFDDEYAGRRFHFQGRVEKVEINDGKVEFAATAYGKMDLHLAGVIEVGSEKGFKKGHDVHFVATVERIESRYSVKRSTVTLWLSGIESIIPPVAPVFRVTESKPAPPLSVPNPPANSAAAARSAVPPGATVIAEAPAPAAVAWQAPTPFYGYPAPAAVVAGPYGYAPVPSVPAGPACLPFRSASPVVTHFWQGQWRIPAYHNSAPPATMGWRRSSYAPFPGVAVAPTYRSSYGRPSTTASGGRASNRR